MTATALPATEQEPLHLPWEVYRRQLDWSLPEGDKWGFHRGRSPVLEIENLSFWTTVLPVGNGCPQTEAPADMVLVGGTGEVQVTVDDATDFTLATKDILHIASGHTYSYRNIGLNDALIYEAEARATDGVPLEKATDYMEWTEYRSRFHWDLPMASDWGNHRASGPHVMSGQVRGHMVQMPPHQSCPWHASPRQVAFFQIDGIVEFHTANKIWQLRPFDLFATRRAAYIYNNPMFESTVFFDLGGPQPPGGATRYWAEDPGFPASPDAEEYETALGAEGERRLVPKQS